MSYTAPTPIASGTTFAQFQAGGASGHLELLIAAQAATTAPTAAPTLGAAGSGHTLPAATYYVVCTESNGFGETTASPASTGQAVTLGQQLTVTYPTLQTNNVSRNLYIGTSSTGPFALCATGVTSATTVLAAPVPVYGTAPNGSYAAGPPSVNTTGMSYTDAAGNTLNWPLMLTRAAKDGNLEDVWRQYRAVIEEFNSGQSTTFAGKIQKLRHVHAAIKLLDTVMTEAGTLIDANAGTFTTAATGIGGIKTVRVWP